MASAFSITTATNNIPISKQRSATVLFTVANISSRPLKGRAVLVMDSPNESQADWLRFSPSQKSERYFDVNSVQDYSVEVIVPVDAAARDYLFHLDMLDTEHPDETYTEGPRVKLLVGQPEKKEKKPFPWWIIAVAVGVLAVIIGALVFWPRAVAVPDVIGRPETQARETMTAAGLAFQPTAEIFSGEPPGIVLTTIPPAGEQVRKATTVFYVRSLGQEPPPPLSGKIAFGSNREGNFEIYVMNADGSSQVRLTNNNGSDTGATWSPDGGQIAFSSNRDGNFEIYVMNAFGNNPIRLTNNTADDFAPTWSADGQWIAFYSNQDGNYEIYMMHPDGRARARLTDSSTFDQEPNWSLGENKIVFSSNRTGNLEIYMLNLDTSELSQITTNNAQDQAPAWSPDGSKIAFASDRDGNREIYLMNADGSDPIRLTNNNADDFEPAWSPDGSWIAFSSNREGNFEIYVMNTDGSNQIRLTTNSSNDTIPAWSR